jgi:hypothetical protein
MIRQSPFMIHLSGMKMHMPALHSFWCHRNLSVSHRSRTACIQPHVGEDPLALGRRHVWSRPPARSSSLVRSFIVSCFLIL